jgi:hypothetical protein
MDIEIENKKKDLFFLYKDTNSWNPFVTDYFLVTVYRIKREKETRLVINSLPFYWNFFLSEFVQCSSLEEKNVARDTQLEQLHVAFKTRISPPQPTFFSSSPSIHPRDNWGTGVVKENKCSGFQVSFQKKLLFQ